MRCSTSIGIEGVSPLIIKMNTTLKFGFININGLRCKVDSVKDVIVRESIDVMCCVETWLETGMNLGLRPVLVDIRKEVRDGMVRGNGGICVLVRKGLKVNIIKEDKDKNWVMLGVGDVKIICAYFAPSESDLKVKELLRQMVNMITNDDKVILIGDLNSRMSGLTGDSMVCSRGRWMREFILEEGLRIRKSNVGKWTSYNWRGKGITDIVLEGSNSSICNHLIVKEDESVGGSDHRLLILDILINSGEFAYKEPRWNVGRLNKELVAEQYVNNVRFNLRDVNASINRAKDRVNEWVRSGVIISKVNRSNVIEEVWNTLKNAIENALENSCGRLGNDIHINKDFNTDTMGILHNEVLSLQKLAQEAVDNNLPVNERRIRWLRYGRAKSRLNKRILRSKTIVYRRTIDLLEDTSRRNEFVKMVNGMKRRELRGISELKFKDINTHVGYFNSTFGGRPEGDDVEVDNRLLRDTDNNYLIIKRHKGFHRGFIRGAIRELARGKASGVDGIPGEAWKLIGDIMIDALYEFFLLCEQLVVIPEDWSTCLVTMLYKNKGSKKLISNYRPISLTCVIRRVYEKVVKRLFENKINNKLSNNQGGFRNRRSTYDQILRLHELMNQNKEVLVTFTDIQSAYDCVDRRILWSRLGSSFGVSKNAIAILRSLFDHNSSRIIMEGELSGMISNKRGLLQGSSLSPCLFNAFIHSLSIELNNTGIRVSSLGESINNLLFADDAALMGKNEREMQLLLDVAERWSIRMGIKFKPVKCKVIARGIRVNSLVIYGNTLAVVNNHAYLGMIFSASGIDWDKSLTPRAEKALVRLHWMTKKGMNPFGWRISMSLHIYKAFIRPMMEYGLGLGIVPTNVMKRLQNVQNIALRKILGVGKNVSVSAMHILCNIEFMSMRNQFLNMKYFEDILKGNRKDHPVGELIRMESNQYQAIRGHNLFRRFRKKNKWSELSLRVDPIEEIDILRVQLEMWRGHANGSTCARFDCDAVLGAGDTLLTVMELSRRELLYLWHWKLGICGGGWRRCHHCQNPLTHEHFLTCGGAQAVLEPMMEELGIDFDDQVYDVVAACDTIINKINWKEHGGINRYRRIAGMLEQCRVITMDWRNLEPDYEDDESPFEALNRKITLMRQQTRERRARKKRYTIIRRIRNAARR